MRKAVGLSGTGSVLDKPYWFKGDSKRDGVLFIAQQLQLVLVFSEQSLESQVLADDRQNLPQQISLPQTLKTNQRI